MTTYMGKKIVHPLLLNITSSGIGIKLSITIPSNSYESLVIATRLRLIQIHSGAGLPVELQVAVYGCSK